jgi:hypothetical protein
MASGKDPEPPTLEEINAELLEALKAFNVKELDIVGATADALVIRVRVATVMKAAAAIARATAATEKESK